MALTTSIIGKTSVSTQRSLSTTLEGSEVIVRTDTSGRLMGTMTVRDTSVIETPMWGKAVLVSINGDK